MYPIKFHSPTPKTAPAGEVTEQQVEAARYALLRRLSPSLRHHMVRNLQPIGMIYGLMDHRLSSPNPDLRTLHQEASKINEFARAALGECTDVSSWLSPEPGALVKAGRGVHECMALLGAGLNFRGYEVLNEVGDPPVFVKREALRTMLVAVLLATTDALREPAVLTLGAETQKDRLMLRVEVAPAKDGRSEAYDDGYRQLAWADVVALASSEDVSVSQEGDTVTMRFAVEPGAPDH